MKWALLLIKQVLQFLHVGDMDLAVPDVDELFGLEIAEGADQGFGGGADVLGDVFPGDRERNATAGRFGIRGEFAVDVQQAPGHTFAQRTIGETEQAFFFLPDVEGDEADELAGNGEVPVKGIHKFLFGKNGDFGVFEHDRGILVGFVFQQGEIADIVAGDVSVGDVFFSVFVDAGCFDLTAFQEVEAFGTFAFLIKEHFF